MCVACRRRCRRCCCPCKMPADNDVASAFMCVCVCVQHNTGKGNEHSTGLEANYKFRFESMRLAAFAASLWNCCVKGTECTRIYTPMFISIYTSIYTANIAVHIYINTFVDLQLFSISFTLNCSFISTGYLRHSTPPNSTWQIWNSSFSLSFWPGYWSGCWYCFLANPSLSTPSRLSSPIKFTWGNSQLPDRN